MITNSKKTKHNSVNLRIVIFFHFWMVQALDRIQHVYQGSVHGSDTRCLAIIGVSGSGKTTILEHAHKKFSSERTPTGMLIDSIYARTPSKPTVKDIATILLRAVGDPLFDKGTENQKSMRLKTLLINTKTRIIFLDEFQHFVDQSGKKIQHHVADWLKVLIDETGVGLVIGGLPRALNVIETNPQLMRRFQQPVIMPSFNWLDENHRTEFINILSGMQKTLCDFNFPNLTTNEMAYRLYCATGGVMGRLINLFTEITLQAKLKKKRDITLTLMKQAARQANFGMPTGASNPFDKNFATTPDEQTIKSVLAYGQYDLHNPNENIFGISHWSQS